MLAVNHEGKGWSTPLYQFCDACGGLRLRRWLRTLIEQILP
ncbi:MAG: hypothetical protein V7K41_20400 [Nostoc sp.]